LAPQLGTSQIYNCILSREFNHVCDEQFHATILPECNMMPLDILEVLFACLQSKVTIFKVYLALELRLFLKTNISNKFSFYQGCQQNFCQSCQYFSQNLSIFLLTCPIHFFFL